MTGTNNEIFERIEKKYLLSAFQYQALTKMIKHYMEIDEYGESTICNVYYDTENYELIRTSLEKPVYKEKLRLRSYGVPEEQTKTFVEIKKKYGGIVYKRRIELPHAEARNYLLHGIRPKARVNGQILKEIDYFKDFYHTVPKMYIAYDRIATYGKENPSIRITYDKNIRYREEDLDLGQGDAGNLLLKNGEVLMEIKVGGAYPLWLTDILANLKIYQVSYSKYGSAYKMKLAKEREVEKLCLPA